MSKDFPDFPDFIEETPREVTGDIPTYDINFNLNEHPADVDKIRITFRCGVSVTIQEIWHSGAIVCSISTTKGTDTFAVYNPNETGYNAMKVKAPVEIL